MIPICNILSSFHFLPISQHLFYSEEKYWIHIVSFMIIRNKDETTVNLFLLKSKGLNTVQMYMYFEISEYWNYSGQIKVRTATNRPICYYKIYKGRALERLFFLFLFYFLLPNFIFSIDLKDTKI